MRNILVVDDDASIGEMLAEYLSQFDFNIDVVKSRAEMHQFMLERTPDLLLVDMNLGSDDGMEIVRGLTEYGDAPVIIMSGKRLSEADRVTGLELGARDYIAKPFNLREMLARVRGALKVRSLRSPLVNRIYYFNGWRLSTRQRRLLNPEGLEVKLTVNEFNVLVAFVDAPKRVLSREQLLLATRVYDQEIFDRSMDVIILRLRRKLNQYGQTGSLLKTQRGSGYVLDCDVEYAHRGAAR